MVTFVIFWAALFSIFFFIAGTFFKALLSAFNALLSAIGGVIAIGGLTMLILLALTLVYEIAGGISKGGLGNVIGTIVMLVIIVGILLAIIGGLGALILDLALVVVGFVSKVLSFVLERVIIICEKGYAKSLMMITRRVGKC